MKLSKLFHSLYFMVMFLPLFIIPIFAININQKSVEPISITTSGWEMQSLYENGTANSINDIELNKLYHSDILHLEYGYLDDSDYCTIRILKYESIDIGSEDILIDDIVNQDEYNANINNYINITCYGHEAYISYTNNQSYANIQYDEYIISLINAEFVVIDNLDNFKFLINEDGTSTFSTSTFNVFNYVYNEGIVYDDTDIGSQFLYSLYKPVRDYFNFSNYFGLNGVYDWFLMTFFNGTAPLVFFIFFNLMIYWLFISLLWLLFDVLIYVPMMIHRWLDKGALE